jgi:predicted DNA-binding transcriptional regulator AlpA
MPAFSMMQHDDYLGSAKLAAMLNVSTMSLYRYCKSKDLGFPQPSRINGRKKWRRSEIVQWMEDKKKDVK